MDEADHRALLTACRVLFGHDLDPPFLAHLRESGLRSAWRRTALQTHPDRALDSAAKHARTNAFIEARSAYDLLREFLARRRHEREPSGARSPRTAAARRQSQRPHPAGPPPRARRDDGGPEPGVPRRPLRLGEFLYHARVIPYGALIEALIWQRGQRDRFGEVGRRWGLLSESDLACVLSARRPHEPVGTAAHRLRVLTAFQVRTVLAFQRSRQEPIGVFFVRRGLLTPAQLGALLGRHEAHNRAVRSGGHHRRTPP